MRYMNVSPPRRRDILINRQHHL